ncbi:MAG TPA: hypothetical protein VE090_05890 [Methylomirabilota bacterium]|nr:hypothetical protein [Methylomirabilota bacterium]
MGIESARVKTIGDLEKAANPGVVDSFHVFFGTDRGKAIKGIAAGATNVLAGVANLEAAQAAQGKTGHLSLEKIRSMAQTDPFTDMAATLGFSGAKQKVGLAQAAGGVLAGAKGIEAGNLQLEALKRAK